MNDLISIIVPIYNVERYLRRCIDSIISQSYSNIEIILIDDGSPDECGKICDEYSKKDSRIKVIHKENEGVSSARNLGLEIISGKYLTFVDPDDYIEKEMIEKLYEWIKKYEADISICGVIDNDENYNILRKTKGKDIILLDRENTFKEFMEEYYFNSVCWAKLYRTDLWKNIRFNEKTKIAEDLEVLCEVFKKVNKTIVNTKECFYNWLCRSESATKIRYNEDWKKEIDMTKNIMKYIESTYPKIIDSAIKRYIRINIDCIIRVIKYNYNLKEINELKNNIRPYFLRALKNKNISYTMKIKLLLIFINPKIYKMLYLIKNNKQKT